MAEILNDLKLATLTLTENGRVSLHKDGSRTDTVTGTGTLELGNNCAQHTVFTSFNGSANARVLLPAASSVARGTTFEVVHTDAWDGGNNTFTFETNTTSDTFSSGSYVVEQGNTAVNAVHTPGNAAAVTFRTRQSATDNCALGRGSSWRCELVGANSWLLKGNLIPVNNNDVIARDALDAKFGDSSEYQFRS